jgi:(2R)-ethylmalonyl-CoA mutase
VSVLSGSHLELLPDLIDKLRAEGIDAAVVAGGIIPEADRTHLLAAGIAAVYTPKDFKLASIMSDIVDLADTTTGS